MDGIASWEAHFILRHGWHIWHCVLRTATPDKAIHGFKCSGLGPFDPMMFSDDDFQAAAVTEKAQPVTLPVTLQLAAATVQLLVLQLSPPCLQCRSSHLLLLFNL